jgi:hypothetical protein
MVAYSENGMVANRLPERMISNALDNCCSPADSLAAGDGQLLYPGRPHSHIAGDSCDRCVGAHHSRPKPGIDRIPTSGSGPLERQSPVRQTRVKKERRKHLSAPLASEELAAQETARVKS